MRLAILHYTLPPTIGGVERVIRDQAAALRTLGHEVELMERRRFVGHGVGDDSSPSDGPFFNEKLPTDKHRHILPHWSQDHVWCFITWRLADSLPREFIHEWAQRREAWLLDHPRPWNEITEQAYHHHFGQSFLDQLDEGHGSCVLQHEECAAAVEQVLQYFDGERYTLKSYVIMPNHVHVLVRLHEGWPVEKVVQNWKERSAKAINDLRGSSGQLWQKSYFDRLIRSAEHWEYVVGYIRTNPERAKLPGGYRAWSADDSSAHSLGRPTTRRRSMSALSNFDAVLIHNVMTMPFDLEWTRELHALAAEHPEIRWINWVHDVAAVNPAYAQLGWQEPVPPMLHVAVSEVRRADYARATGLPLESIHVIPNGIDLASVLGLTPRIAALPLGERDLVLVHPTRLVRRKNIELGLRVLAALRSDGCDATYIITGAPDPHQTDGVAYHRELKSLVNELDLVEHVLFLGETEPLGDEDVRSLYAVADALFFPSTGEGFGLPLIEALAHRLPIFCSNLPVHGEVLGETGHYFQIDAEPKEISAQIMRWLHHNQPTRHRRLLRQRFDMLRICQEHLEPLLLTAIE